MTYDALNRKLMMKYCVSKVLSQVGGCFLGRERFTETVDIGCKEDKFDILYLHDESIEYVLNLKTKKCIKRQIEKPWIDFGIPKDSIFITSTVLGSLAVKDANLRVDLWRNEFKDPFGNKVKYMGTWSTVGCLPIESIYTSDKYKYHTYFSDITVGKSKPDRHWSRLDDVARNLSFQLQGAPEERFKPDPACLREEDSSELTEGTN